MGHHLLLTAHSAAHITSDVHKGKEADEYRGYANRSSPLWLVKQQDYYRTYQQCSYPSTPSYQHRLTEAHSPQSTLRPRSSLSRMCHRPAHVACEGPELLPDVVLNRMHAHTI